jgi:hypothetical protein
LTVGVGAYKHVSHFRKYPEKRREKKKSRRNNQVIRKMVGGRVGCGEEGYDAVGWYNHLYLVPKPATLEGRIKKTF